MISKNHPPKDKGLSPHENRHGSSQKSALRILGLFPDHSGLMLCCKKSPISQREWQKAASPTTAASLKDIVDFPKKQATTHSPSQEKKEIKNWRNRRPS